MGAAAPCGGAAAPCVGGRAPPAVVNRIKAVSGSMATLYNSYFKKGRVKAQRRISWSGQEGRDGGGGLAEMSEYNM